MECLHGVIEEHRNTYQFRREIFSFTHCFIRVNGYKSIGETRLFFFIERLIYNSVFVLLLIDSFQSEYYIGLKE